MRLGMGTADPKGPAPKSTVSERNARALRSRLSNVSRVKNTLNNVCLAGLSNAEQRKSVLRRLIIGIPGMVPRKEEEEARCVRNRDCSWTCWLGDSDWQQC